jgi:hypothetical protein
MERVQLVWACDWCHDAGVVVVDFLLAQRRRVGDGRSGGAPGQGQGLEKRLQAQGLEERLQELEERLQELVERLQELV